MKRAEQFRKLQSRQEPWDMAIIGGGASGVGIALDAASRGYSVLLLEQSDFGKGTSSRSTKLVHGGVRYLQQGNLSLVIEALKERGLLFQNAPHLVHDLPFVVPNYQWWEAPFYGLGLKVYDRLAGKYGFGRSVLLSRTEVLKRIPTLDPEGLRGGVLYHDGQFDDSRLLLNLAQTAVEHGACLLNYAPVVGLLKQPDGLLAGLQFRDEETGRQHRVAARCVINATGAFSDAVRQLDEPDTNPMLKPSQGVHLVLARSFLPGDTAIMVPHTRDGRVMFAIPWLGHVLVGTTDTAIASVTLEPRPMKKELQFLLETAGEYLARRPGPGDVLSVFTGIRPLVKRSPKAGTATLSREHTINISKSGLLSIIGGKWTTYRKMAEDCVDQAIVLAHLDDRPCITRELHVHGWVPKPAPVSPFSSYGSDAEALVRLTLNRPGWSEPLDSALPINAAQVIWAVREEMALTLDDVLARRTRALFLNAAAAVRMAPALAGIMAAELGRDAAWQQQQLQEFRAIADCFKPPR